MEETRIDMRLQTPEQVAEGRKAAQLCFKLGQTMPYTPEYDAILMPGLVAVRPGDIRIGAHCVVMNNCLMMGAGGIIIDDGALVAANVQLISNNHDLYDRQILTCKRVHLKRNCWIGAGSTILPGVTVGENSVVGAASVVTKDIPDNCIAVGNPAKVIKTIPEK